MIMILSEFTYKDASGWCLDRISLDRLNLIVGLNAVGKTRTIMALGNMIQFIKGEEDVTDNDFSCSIRLVNGYDLYYSFAVSNGIIASEILQKGERFLIQRNNDSTRVYEKETNPPASKLVIQIHRDTKAYPEIEEIIQWAEHTSIFVFSNITTSPHSLSPYAISKEPLLPFMFEKTVDAQREVLLNYLRELGYCIDRIEEFEKPNGVKTLRVYESGIEAPLSPFDLSNGMFRVFCILLYMIYCASLSDTRCLIVDDMGEGLDFKRSSKLGKIMFDYCDNNHIQLIVTSNDSFLMDTVNLEYWNILRRDGNKVLSLNPQSHPSLFEKFARTGLGNFDMLSSNFIINHLEDE